MKKIIYVLLPIILFSSCGTSTLVTQGQDGYAGELNEKYTTIQLSEVEITNRSLFGIPNKKLSNSDVYITNTVSSKANVWKRSKLLRILNFITFSSVIPIATNNLNETTIPIGILVGGFLNNILWHDVNLDNAINDAAYLLHKENPEVDLIIYPKYNINSSIGLYSDKHKVKIKAKGAILSID
tara:strand:- start:2335 stop:2883 length:549 start_codon:yes stop_codon:yes gene_type:complete